MFRRNLRKIFAPLVMLSLGATSAVGEEFCQRESSGCVPIGVWEFSLGIGVGGRSNPIVNSDDIPIVLLPSVSYYGERFFWQTDTLGFTLFESRRQMVNIVGTISYDQTFFNEWGVGNFAIESGAGGAGRVVSNFQTDQVNTAAAGDLLSADVINVDSELTPGAGIPGEDDGPVEEPTEGAIDLDRLHDRDLAGLMGLEYDFAAGSFSFTLQGLRDVTSVHDGSQLRAAISRLFVFDGNGVEVTLGAEWRDDKTLNYYYGVREDEVDDARHAHRLDSDLSYYAKIDWRYRLTRRWELRGILHHRVFGDEIKNSPIVKEDFTTAVFFGGAYYF